MKPISVSPVVWNGMVYAIAGDNKVHALEENTGNEIWLASRRRFIFDVGHLRPALLHKQSWGFCGP